MVKEAKPLCAALGLYLEYDESLRPIWDSNGPDRILPTNKTSENLQLMRETGKYVIQGNSKWLVQWCEDQLSGFTGLFARENGSCHYTTFMIACIAAAYRKAVDTDDAKAVRVFKTWLRLSFCWMALFTLQKGNKAFVATVGQRNQGGIDEIQKDQLLNNRKAKYAHSDYYWPVSVLYKSLEPESLFSEEEWKQLVAVRQGGKVYPWMYASLFTRNDFVFYRWEKGLAVAIDRKKGGLVVGYSSMCGAEYIKISGEREKLEPDLPRKGTRRLYSSELSGSRWSATSVSEVTGERHQINVGTAGMGKLRYIARSKKSGGLDIEEF